MRFGIEHRGRVHDESGGVTNPEELDRVLDSVMDILMGTKDAIDPDLSATLSTGEVTIRLEIEAESPSEAISLADAIVRAALHGADIFSPSWQPPLQPEKPAHFDFDLDWVSTQVQPHDRGLIDSGSL